LPGVERDRPLLLRELAQHQQIGPPLKLGFFRG